MHKYGNSRGQAAGANTSGYIETVKSESMQLCCERTTHKQSTIGTSLLMKVHVKVIQSNTYACVSNEYAFVACENNIQTKRATSVVMCQNKPQKNAVLLQKGVSKYITQRRTI